MRKLLIFTSTFEALLGILLMLFPSLVINLIFGIDADNALKMLGHFTGIAIFCFGLACFPSKEAIEYSSLIPAVRGMFAYNFIASVFFAYLEIEGTYHGILLLPALIGHGLIAIYFVYLLVKRK